MRVPCLIMASYFWKKVFSFDVFYFLHIVKANAVHSKPFKLGANCELSCIRGHIKRDSNHEIYMVGIRGTARP
jgi:hypothetical protein